VTNEKTRFRWSSLQTKPDERGVPLREEIEAAESVT
jgi:hypothetical protein